MKSIEITEDVRVKFSIQGEMNIHNALLDLSKEGFEVKVKRYEMTQYAYMTVIANAGNMSRLHEIYTKYSN